MCGWWHLKHRTRCEALSRWICVYSDSIFSNGLTARSSAIIYCCSSHSISRSISSYWLKRTLLKKIAIYCAYNVSNISHPQKCWPAGLYKSVKGIHCTHTTTFSGSSSCHRDIGSTIHPPVSHGFGQNFGGGAGSKCPLLVSTEYGNHLLRRNVNGFQGYPAIGQRSSGDDSLFGFSKFDI